MAVLPLSLVDPAPLPPRVSRSRFVQATHGWGQAILLFLAGMLIWAALLELPLHVAGPELDPSWAQSLAHFCKHRFQAGEQYVFTYGPLGYFITPNYDADLFWFKVAWELILKLILAVAVLRITRHVLPFLPRLIFCLLVAFALSHNPDGSYVFMLFLLGVGLTRMAEFSLWRTLVGTFLLAAVALVKFTLLVQALVAVAIVSGGLLLDRPRHRALLPPSFFGVFLVGWWLILGQSLTNLPRYLYNSCMVAAGYNDAMMYPGEQANIYLALVIFAMLGVTLLSRSFLVQQGARNAVTAAIVLLFLFLQWKHGFVRQSLHQVFFFSTTLLCPFLFPALFPQYRWGSGPRLVLVACAVLLSAVGFVNVYARDSRLTPTEFLERRVTGAIGQAKLVLHLGSLHDRLEEYREQMASRYHMPRIAARVQGASVDAFNYEQGVVLLNHLNWTPRPIFQSYSAYTPYLQALNAGFLAGDSAPEYLIFQLLGFDGRVPALEDSQALWEILRRYHPVLAEGANLLLERNRAGTECPPPAWQPVQEQVVRLGEKVTIGGLPDAYQMVQIHLAYSWKGLMRKTLYRPPFLYLNLWFADNQMLTYRLVPALAEHGFLLNPFLAETGDLVDLYRRRQGKRVVALCLTTEENGRKSFVGPIGITVASTARVVGQELRSKEYKQLRYPMMPPPPDEVCASPALPVEIYGSRQVLVLP
jgi:hypothetical protein